ncbi:hypothetical protein PVK06_008292 [Gossypium arboreum]|uniref:Uncharacterized protein n=1 Tax=Gossypium arboreum TaxID=29729 RepID=A0ABR0QKC1_GOSAR|nr:hypothetical protein PVK06_008292 [Gossypium arboreum]
MRCQIESWAKLTCGYKLSCLGHTFLDYPSIAEVWDDLQITWPIDFIGILFQDWFYFLLAISNPTVSRQIVCALWYIWLAQNQLVDGNAIVQVQDIVLKALACSHAVRLVVDLGLQEVTFEGDSLTISFKACSPLYDVSAIGAYIQDVKGDANGVCFFGYEWGFFGWFPEDLLIWHHGGCLQLAAVDVSRLLFSTLAVWELGAVSHSFGC